MDLYSIYLYLKKNVIKERRNNKDYTFIVAVYNGNINIRLDE